MIFCFVKGEDTPGEETPFVSITDYDRSCDGKNMALFEVQFNHSPWRITIIALYDDYKGSSKSVHIFIFSSCLDLELNVALRGRST